jgi:sugar/nucleoside kinase (ribokinase family)
VPVANVGADAFEITRAALDLAGVDRSQLREVRESNNHVYLTYTDDSEREEILQGMVPPIEWPHLRGVLDVDTLIINLTSGRDVLLPTVQELRRAYAGTIQLDVHSLTLGFDAAGKRVPELPRDWPDWVACVDWVQLNEREADLLRGSQSLQEFVAFVTGLGPQGVLITLGSQGCLVGLQADDGNIRLHHHAAQRHPDPAFATGCGDVFGAAFAFARLRGLGGIEAAGLANAIAGVKAGFESPDEVLRLHTHAADDIATWLERKPGRR